MSASGTRSDADPSVDDAGWDALMARLEAELRASGRLSFATCETLRRDDRLAGFEPCLAFLRCTVFAADPRTPPIARRRRIQVCRLALLSLGAHTEAPRWSGFVLEQMVEAALQTPGAELGDLVHALFALLGDTLGPPGAAQARFVRELARQIDLQRRGGRTAEDLVWIAVRLADPVLPVTEAQAYLASQVLPRRLRRASAPVILRLLEASPLVEEVERTLAE